VSESRQDELENYLAEREKLDAVFQDKFTRVLTVVFTDLKGSTTIAETEGDLVSRMLIKHQNDILLPAIKENNGVFIKSIGDGTLSYFEQAQDAVRAAVRIQKGMDALNMAKKFKTTVLMRIGMHTGKCIVEQSDIAGDVVNTASRFESAATPGDIYMSEDTYNALSDKSEIYCRFVKQVTLKGKKDAYNAYKAFWNLQEIELDKQGQSDASRPAQSVQPTRSSGGRLLWVTLSLFGVVLILTFGLKLFGTSQSTESRRSINESVTPVDNSKTVR
jgi:class 3 adenylate cyclase